jgi:hypothetical protein
MSHDEAVAPVKEYTPDEEHQRLHRLCGPWSGQARTCFSPGEPWLEAPWSGRIEPLLGGRFVRFSYQSSLQGEPLAGEMLIAWESSERLWRTSWIDSFHTGTAILVSEGPPATGAITVKGTYFAGVPQKWGWRTEIDDAVEGSLSIRMYNITPDGQEMLGVEIKLERSGEQP